MNGRFFGGTKVEAYIADGTEKFKKTGEKTAALESEGEGEEEAERLDKFGSWLEQQKAAKETQEAEASGS